MDTLLDFIKKYYYWLLFIILEVISMIILFQNNSYQGSVWFTSANTVTGKIDAWNSAVENFFSLGKVNQELTQRNLYLEQQVRKLSDRLDDVTKDTTWTDTAGMKILKTFRLIPAKVVSNSVANANNLITIDKGSADGVRVDMGVACGSGVVGIVYLTSPHYSIVIPAINTKSNISCRIHGRGYFGYLHWYGGDSQKAYVEEVPRHARFRLYDNVETSGFSSVFPPGILVGKILHVYNSVDGVSYRLQVRLSTDFSRLRDVCVIDNAPVLERLNALRAAQDSLKTKADK